MRQNYYGIALTLVATCALYSDDTTSCNPQTPPCREIRPCHYPHHIDIGGNYTYAWITPKGNPTTRGSLGGTRFLYEYCPLNSIYAAAAFNWRIGNTTRDSSPSRSLQDFNVQERLGYTYYSDSYQFMATFFSGFGGRYMPETVKSGSSSVDFKYTELYVPVGVLLEKQFSSMFSWGIRCQWMPQVFSTVRIVPLSGAQWSLKNRLDNFYIDSPFKVSTESERFSIIVSPFFELWHDGESTAKTTTGFGGPTGLVLGLPSNKYLFTGVNVDFRLSF